MATHAVEIPARMSWLMVFPFFAGVPSGSSSVADTADAAPEAWRTTTDPRGRRYPPLTAPFAGRGEGPIGPTPTPSVAAGVRPRLTGAISPKDRWIEGPLGNPGARPTDGVEAAGTRRGPIAPRRVAAGAKIRGCDIDTAAIVHAGQQRFGGGGRRGEEAYQVTGRHQLLAPSRRWMTGCPVSAPLSTATWHKSHKHWRQKRAF